MPDLPVSANPLWKTRAMPFHRRHLLSLGIESGEIESLRPQPSTGLGRIGDPGQIDVAIPIRDLLGARRIGEYHRVVRAVPEEVEAFDEPQRIGACPSPQPGRIVPGAEIIQAGLVVTLLVAESIPLEAHRETRFA